MEHKLNGKFSKCEFFQSQIHYLGHMVSKDGITVDWEKIKSIMEYIAPKNVTKVISFMGFRSYYRWIFKNFSKIDHLITAL